MPINNTLNVFRSAKRTRKRNSWEPLYIGTNDEPLYDERLSWDGKRDKMSQMYEMCLLNYDLLILDNAFLVHAPGIKVSTCTNLAVAVLTSVHMYQTSHCSTSTSETRSDACHSSRKITKCTNRSWQNYGPSTELTMNVERQLQFGLLIKELKLKRIRLLNLVLVK